MAQTVESFETQVTKRVGLRYLLHRPTGYLSDPTRRWPLLLFLHGLGERGDDLSLLKKHGPPKILEQRDDWPFLVVSPQCPAGSWWSLELDALGALLDHVLATERVDPRRVYLTGLSMGGYGTWHLATVCPERFAAIAPICGGGVPALADRLKDVPVWAFHGALDDVVPLEHSVEMVREVTNAGGRVRFTIYPDADHDSWTRTYDDPDLYRWLLEQARPEQA